MPGLKQVVAVAVEPVHASPVTIGSNKLKSR